MTVEPLMATERHQRYGGPGVIICWHVKRRSICVYSQLRPCSSSEIAAMIEKLPRHHTDVDGESNYVDTHGMSVILYAFTELLGFRLLSRLKNIGTVRQDRPDGIAGHAELGSVLTRSGGS